MTWILDWAKDIWTIVDGENNSQSPKCPKQATQNCQIFQCLKNEARPFFLLNSWCITYHYTFHHTIIIYNHSSPMGITIINRFDGKFMVSSPPTGYPEGPRKMGPGIPLPPSKLQGQARQQTRLASWSWWAGHRLMGMGQNPGTPGEPQNSW